MPSFQRFVALRYLLGAEGREEGRRFLRFVTYVAIGGVALGVAALLLALSIVRGFSREIEAKIIGFGAHVRVDNFQEAPLGDAQALRERLGGVESVTHVAAVVTEFVLLRRSGTEIEGVALWGTDALPPYLADNLVEGHGGFEGEDGVPGLVMGRKLAQQLGLAVGDRVVAFSMRGLQGTELGDLTASGARPRVKQFRVAGFYETALSDYDQLYVFTDLDVARDLLGYGPDEVTRLDLTVSDVRQVEAVAERIDETFGFPLRAQTIYEVFRGLFAWVNLQESIIPLVIGVIIVVAAINIIGTLLMIVVEKTREIGVLASMGASRRMIQRLFVWLGMLIGVLGTGLGLALALSLALLQQEYALIPLPAEAYYMDTAPIALNALDFVVVAVVAFGLCVVASYVPARFAARIDPLKVIRFS